ncbi:hypothetical protein QBC42DRAFT_291451 [Cladorrhinum samala]|uniref:Uncharacterized protein n=1 Tax=Cladorrhinum samala TaxID=585594 RepID=A0AAV9HCS1_9PEZI|nr:hypothetical protein QBC42DRAFT_291451 [Cladorrhinum samala]
MSGSTSIVDEHGTWTASTDDGFKFKLAGADGNATLDLKTSEGKVDGSATIGGVDIGTADNHITVGGGSQDASWNGSLSYGKTAVNILGGSFDLGDGRTDEFQFKFTVDPTPLGPRWTGVATNSLAEAHKLAIPAQDATASHKATIPVVEQKHPVFDQAGIVLPYAEFTGWATHVKFELEVDVAVKGAEATATVTRALEVEVRPIFTPFPAVKWPTKPPPPPFLDPFSKAMREKALRLVQIKALLKFVGESLDEVNKWKRIQDLIATVDRFTTVVAGATTALAAAAAAAAVFLEMNPAADVAQVVAATYLATETTELVASKAAVEVAKRALRWTVVRMSTAAISSLVAGKLLDFAVDVAEPASFFDAKQVADGAKAQFDALSKQHGLDAAGEDLDALSTSLTGMQNDLLSQSDAANQELKAAADALAAAAAQANSLLMYQILLESWTSDPAHAPFLTWPGANLLISSPSEDAEVVDVGDISTPENLAAAAAKMEDYAKQKGYTGFVLIKDQSKAYFRDRDVAALLGTVVWGDYTKGFTSYVRAEKLSLGVLADRWQVIAKAQEV